MDLAIWGLVFVTIIFSFTFASLDVQKNNQLKQDLFTAVRSANQNSLEIIQDQYDHYEEITSAQMMEEWLRSFSNNLSSGFNEIKLNFIQVQEEPPIFLVYVEGEEGRYAILKDKALVEHYSGALIVQNEEGE